MCNVYIAVFVLYYILSSIQPSGLTAFLLIIAICISLLYAVKVLAFKDLPVYFKGLNVFLLLLTLYGLYLAVTQGEIHISATGDVIKSNTNIRVLFGSMLPIYPCYYFARKGELTEKNLRIWAIVFLIATIISYYYAQLHHIQRMMASAQRGDESMDFTNNVGYSFLLLMPLVALFRKTKIIYFSFVLICFLFILSAAKRGAILIGSVVTILLICNYFRQLKLTALRKATAYILMVAILAGVTVWVFDYVSTNDYLNRRLMSIGEGNSSGRDYITDYFLRMYNERFTGLQLLFGGGADYTIISGPNYAHNDWLEVLINEGFVGIMCYLYYWICFYLTYSKYKRCSYGHAIGIIVFILLAKTMFSMSYTAMNIYISSMLGFCMAQCQRQQSLSYGRTTDFACDQAENGMSKNMNAINS